MRRLLAVAAVLGVSRLALQAQDDNNLTVIHRIKAEAFDNSNVMEEFANISDLYGPRLTASRVGSGGAMGYASFSLVEIIEKQF